ncbi:MAG: peptide ABC transporter substrate-binding protein [Oscillospiraceae bacterium]|nr:peptide ABC transporter substrate-binding protein [Oscillospiraceae bacterium]
MKNRKRTFTIIIIAAAIAAFAFLFYTVRSANSGSLIIKYGIDGDPANLDPQIATDYNSLMVIQNIYEGLFKFDDNGELVPAAAESYEISEDKKTYTFFLKPGGKWRGVKDCEYNGNPVTAQDFNFAFRRLFNPGTKSEAADGFFAIKNSRKIRNGEIPVTSLGIKAADKYTLIIELENPDSDFLRMLATGPASPCNSEFFEESGGKYGRRTDAVLGNGPFYLQEWQHGNYLKLRSNDYYRTPPTAPGLNFLIAEPEQLEQYFNTGVTHAYISPVPRKNSGQTISFESVTRGLIFGSGEIWKNKNLRQSLQLSINPELVLGSENIRSSSGFSAAAGLVPPSVSGLSGNKNFRQLAPDAVPGHNLKLAKKRYSAAQQKLGQEALSGLAVIVPKTLGAGPGSGINSGGYIQTADMEIFTDISQVWQSELGFFAAIEQLPADEFNTRLRAGNFDIALMTVTASYDSPRSALDNFISVYSQNLPQLNNILRKSEAAVTTKKRMQMYVNAEKYIINNRFFIPLYFQKEYFIMGKGVRGINFNERNRLMDFRNAYK